MATARRRQTRSRRDASRRTLRRGQSCGRRVAAGIAAGATDLELAAFTDERAPDVVRLVNATIEGWPYCRPIDAELVAHWKTLGGAYQPANMLLAYCGGTARAFLHGERYGATHGIRFLALTPGAIAEGLRLVGEVERRAWAERVERIIGPTCNSGTFYAGYVLGLEPYHPHWAVDGTEVFVRAGFSITQNECILVAEPGTATPPGRPPAGYEIIEAQTPPEFLARPFKYAAVFDGKEVATCAARLYPKLMSPSGGPIGQVGYVGTDKAHRGKGLATLMTEMCLKRLFEWGAGEALISTGLDNPAALRAYEKAGFRRRHSVTEWTKVLAR